MAVYVIEGDIYYGNAATPITNLSGGSGRGVQIVNVPMQRVFFNDDLPGVVTWEPRDVSATTLRAIAADLMGTSDTGLKSSGNASAKLPFQFAYTIQFAVVPISSSEHMLYLPAAAARGGARLMRHGLEHDQIVALRMQQNNPELSFLWARDSEHLTGPITFAATRPPSQSTPAWMKDTPANVATAYSLTP